MRSKPAMRTRSGSASTKAVLVAVVLSLAAGIGSWAVEWLDVPPRTLARYIEKRASGHNDLVVAIGRRLAGSLSRLDRLDSSWPPNLDLRIGAPIRVAQEAAARAAPGDTVRVATTESAIKAIEQARPGDSIRLAPGRYRFVGASIAVNRPGTSAAGITVRADQPETVTLEFDLNEGFVVSAPYWTFEHLNIRGVCNSHVRCEHAFHVVGGADHFTARDNTISDFNAHFKINGSDAKFPDDGLLERNTLSNSSVRETDTSVTPIDLVAASRWTIRENRISDFIKAGSDRVSYGAFAKGGGQENRFERNVVLCEHLLRDMPGQRVGISLGGGSTGQEYCRDARCITEQEGSTIRSNLIMSCSDDGIYVNRSATSDVRHNTLIDTGGISVRFTASSADVEGNLVDGSIRSRDGAALHASDNLQTSMTRLYLGSHPLRGLYRDLERFDLSWAGALPKRQRTETKASDLCASGRPTNPAYGAFEDFAACRNDASARAK